MLIRDVCAKDRAPIAELLSQIDNFNEEEIDVALELIDDSVLRPEVGYRTLVSIGFRSPPGTEVARNEPPRLPALADGFRASDDERLTGYLCFGRTPMTDATVDLYWMAVAPDLQGKGIGRALVDAFEVKMAEEGMRIIRVETSTREGYGKTLEFYLRLDYLEVGRILNFYTDDDHLVTLIKELS